jgi:hypothetical protein
VLRWLGVALVGLGSVFLATDGSRWDSEITSFPGPGLHGLHEFELVGFVLIALGVAALWAAGRSAAQ